MVSSVDPVDEAPSREPGGYFNWNGKRLDEFAGFLKTLIESPSQSSPSIDLADVVSVQRLHDTARVFHKITLHRESEVQVLRDVCILVELCLKKYQGLYSPQDKWDVKKFYGLDRATCLTLDSVARLFPSLICEYIQLYGGDFDPSQVAPDCPRFVCHPVFVHLIPRQPQFDHFFELHLKFRCMKEGSKLTPEEMRVKVAAERQLDYLPEEQRVEHLTRLEFLVTAAQTHQLVQTVFDTFKRNVVPTYTRCNGEPARDRPFPRRLSSSDTEIKPGDYLPRMNRLRKENSRASIDGYQSSNYSGNNEFNWSEARSTDSKQTVEGLAPAQEAETSDGFEWTKMTSEKAESKQVETSNSAKTDSSGLDEFNWASAPTSSVQYNSNTMKNGKVEDLYQSNNVNDTSNDDQFDWTKATNVADCNNHSNQAQFDDGDSEFTSIKSTTELSYSDNKRAKRHSSSNYDYNNWTKATDTAEPNLEQSFADGESHQLSEVAWTDAPARSAPNDELKNATEDVSRNVSNFTNYETKQVIRNVTHVDTASYNEFEFTNAAAKVGHSNHKQAELEECSYDDDAFDWHMAATTAADVDLMQNECDTDKQIQVESSDSVECTNATAAVEDSNLKQTQPEVEWTNPALEDTHIKLNGEIPNHHQNDSKQVESIVEKVDNEIDWTKPTANPVNIESIQNICQGVSSPDLGRLNCGNEQSKAAEDKSSNEIYTPGESSKWKRTQPHPQSEMVSSSNDNGFSKHSQASIPVDSGDVKKEKETTIEYVNLCLRANVIEKVDDPFLARILKLRLLPRYFVKPKMQPSGKVMSCKSQGTPPALLVFEQCVDLQTMVMNFLAKTSSLSDDEVSRDLSLLISGYVECGPMLYDLLVGVRHLELIGQAIKFYDIQVKANDEHQFTLTRLAKMFAWLVCLYVEVFGEDLDIPRVQYCPRYVAHQCFALLIPRNANYDELFELHVQCRVELDRAMRPNERIAEQERINRQRHFANMARSNPYLDDAQRTFLIHRLTMVNMRYRVQP